MHNIPITHPLTHDAALAAVERLGGRCCEARITELRDNTFYAVLVLEQHGERLEVDMRPSDAVNFAIRVGVPIFANESLPFNDPQAGDSPGDADPANGLHRAVGHKLVADGRLKDPAIVDAFRSVPRHLFLPGIVLERAYSDTSVATKVLYERPRSSCSQPSTIALMLEALQPRLAQRVLEIGAGTGYTAALLAEVVGDAGHVTSVDIDPEVVEAAERNLLAAGLGSERVTAIAADGTFGIDAGAVRSYPGDRRGLGHLASLARAACSRWTSGYAALHRPRLSARCLRSRGRLSCRHGSKRPSSFQSVGRWLRPWKGAAWTRSVLYLESHGVGDMDGQTVLDLLSAEHRDQPTGVDVSLEEIDSGLLLWLAAREPALAELVCAGAVLQPSDLPWIIGAKRPESARRSTYCLLEDRTLAGIDVPRARATRYPPQDSRQLS